MGNFATGTALGFKYIKTSANIPADVNEGDILFIEDTHQIRVNGVYFSISSTAFGSVQSELAGAQSKIATLEHNVGTTESLSKALLVIVNELKAKLDGGSYTGEQGAQSGTAIASGLDASNTVAAINKLYEMVQSVESSAGVQSVNGLAGVVTLNGTNVSTTDGAGKMFGMQTLDTAFRGVQSNIDGIQARITAEESTRGDVISGVQTQISGAVTRLQSELATSISGVQNQFNNKIDIGGNQSVKDYVDSVASSTLKDAKDYVDQLGGTNWTEAAATVRGIIDELSEDGNATFTTVVDKIRGNFGYQGNTGNQSIKEYIDYKTAAGVQGAQTLAGNAETNAKDYTDTKIAGLDGTQSDNYNNGSVISGHVGVQVTQEDGKIKSIDIVETNIASATELQSVQTELAGAQGRIGAVETRVSGVEEQLKWTVIN